MTQPRVHDLKCWPDPFEAIWVGDKTMELRKDDRGYAVGHILLLREWSEAKGYSGRTVWAKVTHLLRGPSPFGGLERDYVIMSIQVLDAFAPREAIFTAEQIAIVEQAPAQGA